MLFLAVAVAAGAWMWQRAATHRRAPELPAPPAAALARFPAELSRRIADARVAMLAGPQPAAAVAELGRLYHANGFSAEAAACWQWLHRVQRREGRWPYYLAELHRASGEPEPYEAALEQTLQRAPDYAAAWLQLADLQFKTGRREAAAAAYQRRLALLPQDPYAGLGLARLDLQAGRRTQAQRRVDQIVQAAPDFAPAQNLQAELRAAAGDVAGARLARWRGAEVARYREPEDPWRDELLAACLDPERLQLRAKVQLETRQGDGGVALARRAVELAPAEAQGYEVLIEVYLKNGDAEGARETGEEARQRAADAGTSLFLHVYLSRAYRQLGRPAEALRVAEAGRVAAPEAHELWQAAGSALADLGRHEEAAAAFHRALAGNPNEPMIYFKLGQALLSLGQPREARQVIEQALVVQPTFAPALTLLAQTALEAGEWQAAGRYVHPLFDALPGVPAVQQLMGQWCLSAARAAEAQGALAEAEAHYQAGIAAAPAEAELWVSLGHFRLEQGRVLDALAPLETHYRLRPDHAQGALFLGHVYAQLGRREPARSVLEQGLRVAEQTGQHATAENCRAIIRQL